MNIGRPPNSKSFRGSESGQSEMLGYILLLSMVVVGGSVVLLLGGAAVGDLQDAIQMENAESAMREVDSRLARVAFSSNDVEKLRFGDDKNRVTIHDDSYMNVTANRNATCSAQISMGSMEKEVGDRQIAYEGGGVWRQDAGSTTLVSPPDFQYRNGTIDFPVVSVDGQTSQSDQLLARQNVTETRERSREISRQLSQCGAVNNVTITVHSRYYDGWSRYFEQVTNATATTDPANETTTIFLKTRGDPTAAEVDASTVTANSDYVAEIQILSTEGSVTRNFYDGGADESELNDPYSVRLVVDGEIKTPWRDNDMDDDLEFFEDNVNRPWTNDTPRTVSMALEAGTNLSVEAAIHNCDGNWGAYNADDWAYTGQDEIDDDGDRWHQYQCVNDPDDVEDSIQVRIDSQSSGDPNLVILKDGEQVPGYPPNGDYQQSLQDVLGSKIDGSRTLHLDSNQVVFVYELSSDLTDSDNDGDLAEHHSGDYNDAVVLVTFYQQGNIAPSSSFSIKITASQVTISDDG